MRHLYCPKCGARLGERQAGDDGAVPYCGACGRFWFDAFATCVIVLVVNGRGEVLLLRQDYLSRKHATIISGYMKPGENAEQAARREVLEEVGLTLSSLRYGGTCWFAPGDMLMIGFIGRAESDELRLSGEVNAAQWVDPAVAATLVVPKTPGSPVHMLLDLQRTLSGAET